MTHKKVDKKLIEACKQALRQLIQERDEAVCQLVMEEVEEDDDVEFGKRIEEGLKGPRVPEERIMKLLKGKK
ncbi:MAG: hypothetical protein WCT04_13275 [Planctomycetota bacterium]